MSLDAGTTAAPENAAPEGELDLDAVALAVFGDDAKPPVAVEEPSPVVEAPKPPPVDERVSARILAAKRADLRAAETRKQLQTQQAEIEKGRAELADLAKVAEQVKAAKLSPSKALELLGFDAKTFLESLATEHEPDAIAKRAVEGTLTEVQKLRAELDSMRQAEADREKAARIRKADEEAQRAGTGFLDFVAQNAEKYPNLVEEMTPAEIVNAGFACLHEVVGRDAKGQPIQRIDAYMAEHDGAHPSDDEIAEFLEYRTQPRAKARAEWRTRIGQKAPVPSQGETTTGDQRAAQPVPGPSPRTLTSRAASEKAAAAPQWSQEAADEESLRIIRAALAR